MNQELALQRRARVEEFRRKHRTGLLTLVFTDIGGSGKHKQALRDCDGVALIQDHHALVREILGQFQEDEEISRTLDSFFIVFVKPSSAVSLFARRSGAPSIGTPFHCPLDSASCADLNCHHGLEGSYELLADWIIGRNFAARSAALFAATSQTIR